MYNWQRSKLVVAISTTLFLTACGGGSSDGGGKAPKGPAPTQESVTINLDEGTDSVVQFAGSITSVTAQREIDGVTAVESEGGITVAADDLTNDVTARYRVSHEDGGKKYETTLTVNGINISAAGAVQQAERTVSLSTERMILADEKRLSQTVLEIQYLAGLIDASEKVVTTASIQNAIDQSVRDTQGLKDALEVAVNQYKAGKIDEPSLLVKLSQMEGGIQDASEIGRIVIEEMNDTLTALGVALPAQLPVNYDSRLGRYTRFTNAALGSYEQNGGWKFSANYDWLNAALPLTSTN